LRSPSRFSGFGASAMRIGDVPGFFTNGAGGADALSAAPQSPQKRLSGGLSARHCGQRFASGAPQSRRTFCHPDFQSRN
jgi:hypothetical protein